MADTQYVLYTYSLSNAPICHVYGPADQAACEAEGEKLFAEFKASNPGLSEFTFMVVPLEALPAS